MLCRLQHKHGHVNIKLRSPTHRKSKRKNIRTLTLSGIIRLSRVLHLEKKEQGTQCDLEINARNKGRIGSKKWRCTMVAYAAAPSALLKLQSTDVDAGGSSIREYVTLLSAVYI